MAIVILTSFVFFIYNEFNGNPISKFRAEKALKDYLAESYNDSEFQINGGYYDFKFNEYSFKVTKIGSGTVVAVPVGEEEKKLPDVRDYQFTVHGFWSPQVRMDGIRISQRDHSLIERLGEEAAQEIQDLLKETVQNVYAVDVSLEILSGQFEKGVTWDKQLPLDRPFSIFIVLDSSEAGIDDVYEAANLIQKTLNESGYQYSRVNINANVINGSEEVKDFERGYVKYAIAFDKDEKVEKNQVREFK